MDNEAALQRVVRDVTGGVTLQPEQFAERATEWLRKRHAYSLSVRMPRGAGDDIVRWLDSNEPGFCEHFASALVVLCRAAGHPARVVAGFRGGSLNGFEDYLMVRNSDAHAWAEVFNGADAWVRIDPTPGGAVGETAATAQVTERERDSSWTARFDSLRVLWYRRVVSFDARQQVELMDSVKNATTSTGDVLRARLDAWAKRLKAWLAQPWDGARLLRAAAGIVLAAALLIGGGRATRWLWARWQLWRNPGAFDPVRREAGRWLKTIAEGGARNAERQSVCGELERLRYGPRETWPEPRGVFRRARKLARRRKV